ncbi:TolC family protein [Sandarakinorhabdus sp. DWP1-3-1]|uniref:TolC family protein n=1 Tax=Sandarakinorhabdus sp. DWP1-3-1 TaxID=2804627 RepID=UPI003CF0FC59
MPLLIPLLAAAIAAPAIPVTHDDPRGLIPVTRPPVSGGQAACGEVPARPLTLPDLVDIALCRNPQTAVAWAGVRGAAAGIGIARSAYLPTIDLAIGPTLNRIDTNGGFGDGSSVNSGANLAVNYLLFDGGGRAARVASATARQRSALAQYADAAQGVVLDTVAAYNGLLANRAVETANIANVAFARQSRDLAAARRNAGVATSADRLQAETSLSQAELQLIQTRGNLETSAAQLAVTIGLPPQARLDLAAPAPLATGQLLQSGADALIADAERLRPDLVAARANVAGAEADVRAQLSAGRPSVGVSASNNLSATDTRFNSNSGNIGLTLSIPIFSGFNQRYSIASARAEAERQAALAEQTRQQAGLSVYTNFVSLRVALASLETARVLIASATESANLAQGRYRAGVGLFADLLNAQSALASARQQLVQSEFNVRNANANLARAIGGIGEAIDAER